MTVRPVTSGHHRETGVNSECTSTLPEQASLPDGGYYAMAIHISCCVHAVSWQDSCDSGLPRRAEGRYGLPTSLKERHLVPGHLVAVRIPHSMWHRWYMPQVCVLDTVLYRRQLHRHVSRSSGKDRWHSSSASRATACCTSPMSSDVS